MGTGAEFDGVVAYIDDADDVAVFFAEEGDAVFGFLVEGGFVPVDGGIFEDGFIDVAFDLFKFFWGEGLVVGEVEAEVGIVD